MSELRPIDISSVRAPGKIAPGAAPMLQWIEVKDLVVDDLYQRAPHLKAVQAIADAFDWRKFSAVVVAPIEGGLFAVIDGQHRCHAAAACGIEKVPCQVTIMDRAEQARAFAAINGQATPVTIHAMFKAAIAAGELWAVEVRDTCAEADCHAMTYVAALGDRKPGHILAIGFVRKAIAQHGREKVSQALRILRRTDELGADKESWNVSLLQPIVGALATRPHVLKNPDEATVALDEADVWTLSDRAREEHKRRMRVGMPSAGVKDFLESLIGDALDKAMSGGGR